MRIDSIHIENFRGLKHLDLDFDPRFTLLVGDNASGKTSILSAVAAGLGIWHVCDIVRGAKQWRNIMDHEIREVPGENENGEQQFEEAGEVIITTRGAVHNRQPCEWTRRKRGRKSRTVDVAAGEIADHIRDAVAARDDERKEPLPLLAYYNAGRAWMASNERELPDLSGDLKTRRADGYYDCLTARIRVKDILKWFILQAAGRDEQGNFSPAFEAVRLALSKGIPGVNDIYWDRGKREVVVNIRGVAQPFSNLSDGQRTMAATLADMAIRAVTLNPHLLGNGNGTLHPEEVLHKTPGVVLLDEVDVHLHPSWQRSVVKDLTETFPKVQFICSSHSPQVFGELPKERILVYSDETKKWDHPSRSLGVDSSRILDEEMEASSANSEYLKKKGELAEVIDKEDFPTAEAMILGLAKTVGEDDPDITRARTLMAFLQDTK